MHQNHYFLKHLAKELNEKLSKSILIECFSQNKDELILGFNGKYDFWIKADLSNQQGLLSFPADYKRARKNSINLFIEAIGLEVQGVRAHENERSFQISFENNYTIVFKLFGKWNNILLYVGNTVTNLFNNSPNNDRNLLLAGFDRKIDQTKEAFDKTDGDLQRIFPTFGKLITVWLKESQYDDLNLDMKWSLVQELLQVLDNTDFSLVIHHSMPHLTMVAVGQVLYTYKSAIKANSGFVQYLMTNFLLQKEQERYLRKIQTDIERGANYTLKCERKIDELTNRRFDQIGDIIMANLHQIKSGLTEVELDNFYTDQVIKIKLNDKLSPQKNAERYYQKSKNEGIEIKKLRESIDRKRQEIKKLETLREVTSTVENLKDLNRLFGKEKVGIQSKPNVPYHKFEIDGFKVLVGKNSKANDRLTLDHTHKDDLWFHARDVAGSHVVLKMQSGRVFPMILIEKTAQLAAWYSKGRNFPLCPVIYTPKKWVRKPKGFTPGMMKVEREEVILVKPLKPT
ncbi:MAG: NFACT RNA binding domain-containing protein [Bacteroidetes bacterium]|nr:NFACT RNA binding domain-containing protein [Bacteroidota bacterium]MDA1120936.1 NFACT RNA binding domain-containing protein [Bacteroidota bacterium]